MNSIFKRLSNLISASINDLIDQAEDPERMIKQVIREMEEHIRHAKEGVLEAVASEKQLEKQLQEQCHMADEWQKKAEAWIESDQESLARSALERKKEHEKIIKNLNPAWKSAVKTSRHLKDQLHTLETKLEEAQIKRSTLVARERAASARHQMEKTKARFEAGNTAFTEFDRMEDKVNEMEARADAVKEINANRSSLEKQFMQMEIESEIEDELQAMKEKVSSKKE